MAIASVGAAPASAASLSLLGEVQTEYGTANGPAALANGYPATASTSVTSSQTTTPGTYPNENSSATYSAYLSLGDLGLSGGLSAFCNGSCVNLESSSLSLYEWTSDVLTITGASSGMLAVNFSVDGTFSGSSNNPL
jgi:hypothetical protein